MADHPKRELKHYEVISEDMSLLPSLGQELGIHVFRHGCKHCCQDLVVAISHDYIKVLANFIFHAEDGVAHTPMLLEKRNKVIDEQLSVLKAAILNELKIMREIVEYNKSVIEDESLDAIIKAKGEFHE